MQQKGIFKFCRELNRSRPEGQIAVFLVLLIAVIFLFTVITINIGQLSAKKSKISIATDGAALLLASNLSSYGNAQWTSLMQQEGKTPEQAKEEGLKNNWQTCKTCWTCVVTFALMLVLIITAPIVGGWFAWAAAAAGVTSFMLETFKFTPDAIKGSQNLINQYLEALPTRAKMVELSAHYALNTLVDDPTLVQDVHDINENGDTTDWVPAISVFEAGRLKDLVYRSEQPIYALRDQIKNFNVAADNFRRYLGGKQAFPEFFYDDFVNNPQREEIARSKYKDDPLLKADLALKNDEFYPENGTFMKLLADLEVVNLPGEAGSKEPISIKNIDIRNLGQTDLALLTLPEYEEEFKYDFKFWEGDGGGMQGVRSKFGDCQVDPYDFIAVEQYNEKTCPDHVDYVVHLLEQWRFWAYGGFMLEKPDDQTSVIFQKGIANLPDSQLIPSFNLWYRQLLNIDDYDINGNPLYAPPEPTEGEIPQDITFEANYRRTMAAQLGLILNMAAGVPSENILESRSACAGLSWMADLEKVRCKTPFFDKTNSDYKNKKGYEGLVGKRKELQEKEKAVCNRMTELIATINSDEYIEAHPADKWDFGCSECFTLITRNSKCNGSYCGGGPGGELLTTYTPECKPDGITTLKTIISNKQNFVNKRIADIPGLITDLQSGKEGCKTGSCLTSKNQCKAACPKDDQTCLKGCDTAFDTCVRACQAPIDTDIAALQAELTFRKDTEKPVLDKVAALASALELLAASFDTTTALNNRVEDAIDKIKIFWGSGNSLYAYIKDYGKISGLKKIDQGVPPNLPDLPETKVTYPWVTKDVNGNPLQHYVRITVNNTFKLPVLKAKRCKWIFGRGVKMENHSGTIWVRAQRFDEDKILSLGPAQRAKWLNWVLRSTRRVYGKGVRTNDGRLADLADLAASSDPLDRQRYEEIVNDPNWALIFGNSSTTYADYGPVVERIRISETTK